MRSIVYTSTQTRPITDAELAQILAVGREKNTSMGVTGILAHKGDNCIGILEGDDEVVGARFEQVRLDPRHTNVRVLLDEPIQQRSFPDWSMAFQPLDPLMQQVPGFSDLFAPGQPADPAFGSARARGLLEWFRKHPLAPLTSRTAEEDEAPRSLAIIGAIIALRDGGVSRFGLDVAAAHAGMPVEDLRQVFPTEGSLLAATVERWTRTVSGPLTPLIAEKGTVAFLHALLLAQSEEPALVELLAASLASAADPTVDGADYHRSTYRRFRQTIRDGLAADVREGREPATMDPVRGAQQLLALHDGLRLQALLTADTDLVDAFDRAATRLRRGWSEQYEQPSYWDVPVTGA
ncbi:MULTISPECIES: BLUF domain-containing protein [unclassified Curtobacterium]|uniref:BLUF domain-containing protein n=1 Tax=unclassified Curtobacterium TaxID=257496 RepID=UPI000826475F|nr:MULTISPECIES: BLUF domain-containing protein [unclassified Curtobacterium]WIA97542.1 BLUF domain-containing protein [Curtobacterium sp. MCBA15_004]